MSQPPPSSRCQKCGQPTRADRLGGLCPRCLSSMAVRGSPPTAHETVTAVPNLRFGAYELRGELGRGAMGAVFRARDPQLGRDVALKIILAGQFASAAERRRFLAEAEHAARLDHPNIVPIYQSGETDGRAWFAMKLIEGTTLAASPNDVARMTKGGASPPTTEAHPSFAPLHAPAEAARLVAAIARAVRHAHERGVLHRDLKPANILLDRDGTPHVTDFGLARRLDVESSLTLSGSPVGTPGYMAPELARGASDATTSADLWSLGAILYELLAGRPPFTGDNVPEVLRKIAEEEPRRIANGRTDASGRVTSSAFRDLEVITLKCLRKDPAQRYATAAELADDLDRSQSGQPIAARPVTTTERAWLWCRRRPAVAALTVAVLVLILVVAVGGPIVAFRLAEARQQERAANRTAQEKLFDSLQAQARASRLTLEPGRREAGLHAIRAAAKIRVTPELRDEAVALLAVSDHGTPMGVTNHVLRGDDVALDDAFRRCLRTERDGSLSLRELDGGKELFRWPAPPGSHPIHLRRLSPDGSLLAINYSNPRLQIISLTNRQVVFDGADTWFGGFSRDGTRFAGLRGERVLGVHESATGRLVAEHRFDKPTRAEIAFHPLGETVVAVPVENRLLLWNWTTDQLMVAATEEAPIRSAAWHGDQLALALLNGGVRLVDFRTQERQLLVGHHGIVDNAIFSPDGNWLVSTFSYDGTANWWDPRTGSRLLRSDRLHPKQFSRDGSQVLLANANEWALASVVRPKSYRATPGGNGHFSRFSEDGRWLLCAGPDGFDIREATGARRLLSQTLDGCLAARVIAEGRELVTVDRARILRWELMADQARLRLGNPRPLFAAPGWRIEVAGFSPDGSRVALTHSGMIELLDLRAPGKTVRLTNASVAISPTFSPDDRWLVTGTFQGRGLQVWDAQSGAQGPLLYAGNVLTQFSPDGTRLLAATSDRLMIFETGSWKRLLNLPTQSGSDAHGPAAWNANGRLLAYAYRQTQVVLLDTGSWQPVMKLESPDPLRIQELVFDPTGEWLVATSENGRLEWWNLRELRQELEELGVPWNCPPAGIPTAPQPADLAAVQPAPDTPALPSGFRVATSFPARPPAATPAQLDLTARYNARLDEDWHLTGSAANSLATFPAGLIEVAGTQFDVRGIVQLASASFPPQRTGYPLAVTNLPVGRSCRALHFLGASGWVGGESFGALAGNYVIRYADGATAEVPIRLGQETGDWWREAGQRFANDATHIAWGGVTPAGREVRLFQHTWTNPRPEAEIVSLDFVSARRGPAPFLLAITAE